MDFDLEFADLDFITLVDTAEHVLPTAETLPEIDRLDDFIKSLELELRASHVDLIESTQPALPKEIFSNEDENEDIDIDIPQYISSSSNKNWTEKILSPFDEVSSENIRQIAGGSNTGNTSVATTIGSSPDHAEYSVNGMDVSSVWLDTSVLSSAGKRQNMLSPTSQLLHTPNSRVDAFLLALEKAGYVNLQLSTRDSRQNTEQKTSKKELSGLRDSQYDYFFASALGVNDDEAHKEGRVSTTASPLKSPNRYDTAVAHPLDGMNRLASLQSSSSSAASSSYPYGDNLSLFPPSLFPSPSDEVYIVNKLQRNFIAKEDFTIESLRRNWDMEEEDDEEEETADGSDSGLGLSSTPLQATQNRMGAGNHVGQITPLSMISSINNVPLATDTAQSVYVSKDTQIPPSSEVVDKMISTDSTQQETEKKNSMNLEDLRLHGDFSVMSNGDKMNGDNLSQHYVGLYDTALTHYNDGGRLLPMNCIAKYAIGGVTTSGSNHTTSHSIPTQYYYTQYIMECFVRPDIENTLIYSVVTKYFKSLKYKAISTQRNHFKISPTMQSTIQYAKENKPSLFVHDGSSHHHSGGMAVENILFGNNSTKTMSSSTSMVVEPSFSEILSHFPFEWDHIDLQIAISRDVRQRVLLLQFVKKVPIPALLMTGTGNSSAGNSSSSSATALATALSTASISVDYIPINKSPMTKKLMSGLKKELILNQISLSCLYHIPIKEVCTLPYGLDKHFLAQLHTSCRDEMWKRLQLDFKEMDEYLSGQESQCLVFYKAMESMYKQYALKFPLFWSKQSLKQKKSKKIDIEEAYASPVKQSSSSTPSNKKDAVPSFEERIIAATEQKHVAFATPERTKNKQTTTPEHGCDFDPLLHPPSTPPSPLNQNEVDDPLRTPVQTPSREDNDHTALVAPLTPNTRMNQYMKTLMSSTRTVDGMTFCLVMLDKCYQELQDKCDGEFMQKIQERHELTFEYVQEMTQFKKQLLNTIMYSSSARMSPFMTTFFQTFHGVPLVTEYAIITSTVTVPPVAAAPSKKAVPTSTTTTSTSSWFSNLGDTLTSMINQPSATTTTTTNKSAAVHSAGTNKPKPAPLTLDPPVTTVKDSVRSSSTMQQQQKKKKFTIQNQIVFYYCTALVGTIPGTLYITTEYICIVSSMLGLNQKKEIFGLSDLTDVVLPETANLLTSRTMKLVFFTTQKKEVTISPAVECATLRMIISEVQKHVQQQQDQHSKQQQEAYTNHLS